MIVVLRVLALLLLIIVAASALWILFVNLTNRENSMWYGGRPSSLGVKEGKLGGPKNTPNSVVSESVDATHPAHIAPIKFSGDPAAAWARFVDVVKGLDRVTVHTTDSAYLCAEFRTAKMRYVDDFEARLDVAAGVIHVRSASRLGKRDFDVNRSRVEMIRKKFAAV